MQGPNRLKLAKISLSWQVEPFRALLGALARLGKCAYSCTRLGEEKTVATKEQLELDLEERDKDSEREK